MLRALAVFNTFEVVSLPSRKKSVDCKYVFEIKFKPNGDVDKHKVRMVAQGFLQQEGVDYNEIFAPFSTTFFFFRNCFYDIN